MKRRKFLQSGMLGGASLAVNLSLLNYKLSERSSATMTSKQRYNWIILYWMPYDNDLWRFGEPILQMLAKGVQSENILVAVQADFWGANHLSRHVITKGNVEIQRLQTANSASAEVFAEYLNWAHSRFVADKWAIAFLGHGGGLDEVSPDENPGLKYNFSTQWMNIHKISEVIRDFNTVTGSQVELFFFQNCNKGTIEAHYTLREVAAYTLSSQKLLGAPNYYYESMLKFLGQHPEINGGQLAEKIAEFERSDMYNSYTVTDNRHLRKLPAQLNPLIDEMIAAGIQRIKISDLKIYSYSEENYVDLVFLLTSLAKQAASAQKRCDEFVEFFKTSLIYKYCQNPNKLNPDLSGLGIFIPGSKQQLEKYKYLAVYSDLKLSELFEAILFDPSQKK